MPRSPADGVPRRRRRRRRPALRRRHRSDPRWYPTRRAPSRPRCQAHRSVRRRPHPRGRWAGPVRRSAPRWRASRAPGSRRRKDGPVRRSRMASARRRTRAPCSPAQRCTRVPWQRGQFGAWIALFRRSARARARRAGLRIDRRDEAAARRVVKRRQSRRRPPSGYDDAVRVRTCLRTRTAFPGPGALTPPGPEVQPPLRPAARTATPHGRRARPCPAPSAPRSGRCPSRRVSRSAPSSAGCRPAGTTARRR